jgi:hypothetical protein
VHTEIQSLCERHGFAEQLHGFQARHQRLHDILTDPGHDANARWWKLADQDSTRELFFQTTLDRVDKFQGIADGVCERHGWRNPLRYVQPQLGGRCCHVEFVFPHREAGAGGEDDRAALRALIADLSRELRDNGAFFSRPYRTFEADTVADTSERRLAEKLRGLFDPSDVFAPNALRAMNLTAPATQDSP